jgi:RimJ/RimL family protein N-acetyltransferase
MCSGRRTTSSRAPAHQIRRDDRPMDPLAVRLRPFDEADLSCFDRWANDPEYSPLEWHGFSSADPWRRRWREDRLLGASPYCLVVAAVEDNSFVGWVDWRQNDRPGPGVWEIGVLIAPECRGCGAGTAAQRLLVDYLFSTTACHRVWAGTEVDNMAEQRALERVGLFREGCARGAHFRNGEWRDSYVYGITRDDWQPPSA